jgi:hypothetical protein
MFRRILHIILLAAYCTTFPVLAVTHVHPFTRHDAASVVPGAMHHHGTSGTIHTSCDVCYRIATSVADGTEPAHTTLNLTPGIGLFTAAVSPIPSAAGLPHDGRAPPSSPLL